MVARANPAGAAGRLLLMSRPSTAYALRRFLRRPLSLMQALRAPSRGCFPSQDPSLSGSFVRREGIASADRNNGRSDPHFPRYSNPYGVRSPRAGPAVLLEERSTVRADFGLLSWPQTTRSEVFRRAIGRERARPARQCVRGGHDVSWPRGNVSFGSRYVSSNAANCGSSRIGSKYTPR